MGTAGACPGSLLLGSRTRSPGYWEAVVPRLNATLEPLSPASPRDARGERRHARRHRIPPRCSLAAQGSNGQPVAVAELSLPPIPRATEASHSSPAGPGIGVDASRVAVRAAEGADELYACAWLRAHAFTKFARLCSPEIMQRQRQLRAEEEAGVLEAKVAGRLPGFPRTACLMACAPVSGEALLASDELPLLVTGPLALEQAGPPSSRSGLAVGTLDLNLGARLPGEDLVGNWPQVTRVSEGEEQWQRAYISNVCVAPAWQNRRIAGQLLHRAEQVARSWGVLHLYIHVEMDNMVARRAYQREGYLPEKQESAAAARMLSRKPRLLLHKALLLDGPEGKQLGLH